jgi:septum formation protein
VFTVKAPVPGPTEAIILASASPRRQQLLEAAGIRFSIEPVEIDEGLAAYTGRPPGEVSRSIAIRKALARAALSHGGARIVAADTIVVAPGGAPLGKPSGPLEARAMIEALAGREHIVVTGVAVIRASTGVIHARAVESRVRLNPLDSADLDSYIASDLWRDKAGAYGVQDDPSVVAEVKGSRSNVMGLPMEAIAEMLGLC